LSQKSALVGWGQRGRQCGGGRGGSSRGCCHAVSTTPLLPRCVARRAAPRAAPRFGRRVAPRRSCATRPGAARRAAGRRPRGAVPRAKPAHRAPLPARARRARAAGAHARPGAPGARRGTRRPPGLRARRGAARARADNSARVRPWHSSAPRRAARAPQPPLGERSRAHATQAWCAAGRAQIPHGWCVCWALQLVLCALAAQASALGAPARAARPV
jgi:hypothetical protein